MIKRKSEVKCECKHGPMVTHPAPTVSSKRPSCSLPSVGRNGLASGSSTSIHTARQKHVGGRDEAGRFIHSSPTFTNVFFPSPSLPLPTAAMQLWFHIGKARFYHAFLRCKNISELVPR